MIEKIFTKEKVFSLLSLMIIISLTFAFIRAEDEKSITADLHYKEGTSWDSDDDGIETVDGLIDFTVEDSLFNWDVNHENLCTRWSITNLETDIATVICNGNIDCCNFVELQPTENSWNQTLELYYGLYDSGHINTVGAQVIYIDNNLSNLSSEIYYSDWQELDAVFINNLSIDLYSPEDGSVISTGENVYLIFSVNEPVNASYSLDQADYINIGQGTEFSLKLNTTLNHGVIKNGVHNLSIYIEDEFQTNFSEEYSFIVNDTSSPVVYNNVTNNSIIESASLIHGFNLSLNEYAKLVYRINNGSKIDMGIDKHFVLELTLVEGENILYINATDLHGNSKALEFIYYLEIFSCTDGMQNGDETGIDCGGSCDACIEFEVSMQKSVFNMSEDIKLYVTSRADSYVNISVYFNQDIVDSKDYNFLYPMMWMTTLDNIEQAGVYTVNATMDYRDNTESKILYFYVNPANQNTLSVTISANATTINEGETVGFSADVTGSTGSLSYNWDFENDGTVDSTSASPKKTYSNNGTFIANLTVFDSKWNRTATKAITVRKLHDVIFVVRNKETEVAINNVEIKVDNKEKNTNSEGKAKFTIPYGAYKVVAEKSGYRIYSKNIDIDNDSVNIYLEENADDDSDSSSSSDSFSINIISPDDDKVVAENNVKLKFKALGKSDMYCKLYLRNSSKWVANSTKDNVKNNVEYSFELKNLENETYEWKVTCTDSDGDYGSSKIYSFIIDTSKPAEEATIEGQDQQNSSDEIINQIDYVMSNLDQLSKAEKEAAEAMMIDKLMERAKTELKRAERDLFNLKWRRVNESERERLADEIREKIKNIEETTPKNIEVIESNEFVSYPSNEDVENVSLFYLDSLNKKLTNKQKQDFIEQHQDLQKLITITTKSKIIAVEYLAGNTGTITLIQKLIKKNDNLSNIIYYESIPKEIIESLNESIFLFDYKVINEDPIIEIDLADIDNYAYYIDKRVELKDIEKISSVLLIKDYDFSAKSSITGLSIFQSIKPIFVHSSNKRLIIEIVIILILIVIYVSYSFGGIEKIEHIFEDKELAGIRVLIRSAEENLKNNDYEKSSAKYKDINSQYRKLDKNKKDKVKAQVIDLVNRINMLFINKLAEKTEKSIGSDEKEKSYSNYKKIQSLYHIIPKQYKSQVMKKCLELHEKIKNGSKK